MFIKNKRFFKKRKKVKSFFFFKKNTLYLFLLKLRPYFFRFIFKKLLKLSKRSKSKIFFCFKKNLIVSKKSKNSRMGKGKGGNSYFLSFTKNKIFFFENFSKTRLLKLKKKTNYFLKNKILLC
jgi:hypothetical protein